MDLWPLVIFQCLNGVISGLIFAMVVLGLSLTFGLMNLMNVAHSAFYMLGAMAAATLATTLGFGFVTSVVGAVIIVTVLGGVLNALVIDRLIGREPLIGLLATAGLLLVIDGLVLAFSARRRSPWMIRSARPSTSWVSTIPSIAWWWR